MLSAQPGTPSHWSCYLSVTAVDASAAKAQQLGARAIVVPPTDIPNIGRFCVLLDPFGAAIALMKGAM